MANNANPLLRAAPASSTFHDVLDLVLDKGLMVDVYARLSIVGIEVIALDARVVVASVETYLRFAEAVNRLDLKAQKQQLFGGEKKEVMERKPGPRGGPGTARAGGPAGLTRRRAGSGWMTSPAPAQTPPRISG